MAQALPELLLDVQGAGGGGTGGDAAVKRVWAARGALALFDYSDEATAPFKALLLDALVTAPAVLRTAETLG